MKTTRSLLSLLAVLCLCAPAAAERNPAPEWGIASQSILTVYAWEFHPLDTRTVVGPTVPGSFLLYAVSSPPEVPDGYIEGPVHLPTGAIIDKIEVAGCDSSPSHDLTAVLYRTQDLRLQLFGSDRLSGRQLHRFVRDRDQHAGR